jgi:hypothetical protein
VRRYGESEGAAMAKKKALTPEEMLQQAERSFIEERFHWEDVHKYGCSDPGWPDGTNLNLIRNHCIFYKRQMDEICKEHSLPMPVLLPIPDEVDDDFMAPYGKFPKRLINQRQEQEVQLCLEF